MGYRVSHASGDDPREFTDPNSSESKAVSSLGPTSRTVKRPRPGDDKRHAGALPANA
jgi:hypothetical protein